jgi:hypothetical protein
VTAPSPATPMPTIAPEPDSRLDFLCAEYEAARAKADEHKARLEELTDGIKTELAKAAPGHEKVLLSSPHLTSLLKLELRERWTVDAKALKRGDPLTYVTYAKQSASWYLVRV